VSVQNVSLGDDLQITWNFNGEEILNVDELVYQFPGAGTYTISLTAMEPYCLTSSTYSLEIDIIPGFMFTLGPDKDICFYENSTMVNTGLDANNFTFDWSPQTETGPSLLVTQPGTYQVSVSNGSCYQEDEIIISQGYEFQGSYGLEICEGQSNLINIPASALSYQWVTGQTTNAISISRAGDYAFSFIDIGGCLQRDTVYVTAVLPEALVFIPNTFTPNGDGVNELFKVIGQEIEEFEIRIFNRWGEVIFHSTDLYEGWNGSVNNDAAHYVPDGTYLFHVNIKGTCQAERQDYHGHITVLR
jgi:gliding motility-associated-like protein